MVWVKILSSSSFLFRSFALLLFLLFLDNTESIYIKEDHTSLESTYSVF